MRRIRHRRRGRRFGIFLKVGDGGQDRGKRHILLTRNLLSRPQSRLQNRPSHLHRRPNIQRMAPCRGRPRKRPHSCVYLRRTTPRENQSRTESPNPRPCQIHRPARARSPRNDPLRPSPGPPRRVYTGTGFDRGGDASYLPCVITAEDHVPSGLSHAVVYLRVAEEGSRR